MRRKRIPLEQFRPGFFLQIKEKDKPNEVGSLIPIQGDKGSIVIGRKPGCDVIIDNPTLISRRHASFSWADGKYIVRDLGSTMGTFFKGKKLTDPQELKVNSQFEIGFLAFVILENPPVTIPLRGENSDDKNSQLN